MGLRWIGLVLAVVAAAAGARAASAPLEAHGGVLVTEATLNGRFTGRFLVDTGATYCVVGREVARKAKIRGRISGDPVRLVTASGVLEARLGEARRVEVGGAVARKVEVAVVQDEPVAGLDGILGLSFLGRFRYAVDPEAGVLLLDE